MGFLLTTRIISWSTCVLSKSNQLCQSIVAKTVRPGEESINDWVRKGDLASAESEDAIDPTSNNHEKKAATPVEENTATPIDKRESLASKSIIQDLKTEANNVRASNFQREQAANIKYVADFGPDRLPSSVG
jgi:hypothetical protein